MVEGQDRHQLQQLDHLGHHLLLGRRAQALVVFTVALLLRQLLALEARFAITLRPLPVPRQVTLLWRPTPLVLCLLLVLGHMFLVVLLLLLVSRLFEDD
jgi:hypothetical protein